MAPTLDRAKTCSTCKHFRPLTAKLFWFKWRVSGADHLSKCAESLEPVLGEPAEFCEFKRKQLGKCGIDGKLWEPL